MILSQIFALAQSTEEADKSISSSLIQLQGYPEVLNRQSVIT